MSDNKSSLSQAQSYKAIGEFWDTHDLADFWDRTEPAEFEVNLESSAIYFAVDRSLSAKLIELARQRGISPETLLNLLIQEKLEDIRAA